MQYGTGNFVGDYGLGKQKKINVVKGQVLYYIYYRYIFSQDSHIFSVTVRQTVT